LFAYTQACTTVCASGDNSPLSTVASSLCPVTEMLPPEADAPALPAPVASDSTAPLATIQAAEAATVAADTAAAAGTEQAADTAAATPETKPAIPPPVGRGWPSCFQRCSRRARRSH